ncbi:hypothetical protein SAMN05444000_105132 [Shimia gijangensis]|uniref:Uncharacterized protein n=1 Tax=Shimia gijangensis TaxID=1470563 RepID=A0A1M6GV23_9RHOB|nr:hypothetical protein SAMN05444000_105132 [Shimia gijangensis]
MALEGIPGGFSDKVKKTENKDGKIGQLGQLAVENDFLSQALNAADRQANVKHSAER